ncbi:MAG: NAD(P)/FAD-dependent oxidoreductase [Gammaproteobacteria bacterium]
MSAPSLWAATAPAAPDCPALVTQEEADVVIVGGGYTGLSAALHLAQEGKQVRLLEAGQPGFGCSGRNGGQVNPGGTRVFPDDIVAELGRERGERFIAIGDASCDLVFDLIAAHDIECEAVRPGYVQGGWGRPGLAFAAKWAGQWARYGVAVDVLDRAGMRDLLGTEGYGNGLYDPRGGSVQPLAYARGLARAAIAAGAHLHGDSKAIDVKRDGSGWRLSTAAGQVRAEFALFCTNGYTGDLWPGLAQTIVPVCSFVAATEPLGHNMLSTILPGKHAVSESCRVIVYYRLDRQGRFIIGGRGNRLNVKEEGGAEHIRRAAVRLFPQLAGVAWAFRWSGWPAMTRNHLPLLIGLDDNAFAGLGYNGRGVAMGTMMGKQLALAVLDQGPALDIQPLRRYPFHAFRQIGVSYHLAAHGLLDQAHRRLSRV